MPASPADRRYSKEHEWVKADGDAARIGITDYAQDQLGDVVYVDLPEAGATIKQFEKMGEIERENLDDVPEIQLGNLIETRILDTYEAAHGGILKRSPDTMRHHEHKWLGALPVGDHGYISLINVELRGLDGSMNP